MTLQESPGHPNTAKHRVRARIGHGQNSRPGVLQLEVLIRELLTIDGLPTWCHIYIYIYLSQRLNLQVSPKFYISSHDSTRNRQDMLIHTIRLACPVPYFGQGTGAIPSGEITSFEAAG